jgi:hypothetical protein
MEEAGVGAWPSASFSPIKVRFTPEAWPDRERKHLAKTKKPRQP